MRPVSRLLPYRNPYRGRTMEGMAAKKKPKLGTGKRFAAVAASARKSGARDPNAVAAAAGRKKYGAKRMAKMAAAGRRRAAHKGR